MSETELYNTTDEKETAASPAPQPAPQKKEIKWAVVLPCVLLAVFLTVCLAVTLKNALASPKTKVIRGITATVSSGANASARSYLGLENSKDRPNETNADVTVEKLSVPAFLSDETAALFEGFGLCYSALADAKTGGRSLDGGITYLGKQYVSFAASFLGETCYVSAPQLLDGWFAITADGTGNNAAVQQELQAALRSFLDKDIESWFASVTVTDLKRRETVSLNGTELECRFYEMLIPNETIVEFTDELFTALYPVFLNSLSALKEQPFSVGADELLPDAKDEASLRAELNEAAAAMGDLTVFIYLDKDGRMVYFETTVPADGTDVFLSAACTGKTAPADDMLLCLVTEDADISVHSTASFHEKNGSYALAVTLSSSHVEVFSMSFHGAYRDVQKGKGYTFALEDMTLSVPKLFTLSLSGSLSASLSDQTVSAPEGQIRSIADLQDSDALVEEIAEHMQSDPSLYQLIFILLPLFSQLM